MGKAARAWIYLGPILLAVLEWLVRVLLNVGDPKEFIGPTIAAAAIALILPLTVLRTLKTKGGGYAQVLEAEANFVFWLSFLIAFMVILWAVDLCLALKPESLPFISGLRNKFRIGSISLLNPIALCIPVYLLGIALTEFRENKRWE